MSEAPLLYELSLNENPMPPSPKVLAAICEAATRLNQYPPFYDDELRAALAAHWGRTLSGEHFFTANSGSEVLEQLARAFLRPQDELIISTPTFPALMRAAKLQEAVVVDVPLKQPNFAVDVEGLLAAITDRTRLLYLCNPNNPTGALITAAEMDILVEHVPDHVTIVSDETYYHYGKCAEFPDSIGHILRGKPIVITHSFSKIYGLAGLRLGYGITTPALGEKLRAYWRIFHLSSLTLAAGFAALTDEAYCQETIRLTQAGKETLYRGFEQLGIPYWPSHTNFILIRPKQPPEEVVKRLRERGIAVLLTTRTSLPGHIRVSVGSPAANQALLCALAEILG